MSATKTSVVNRLDDDHRLGQQLLELLGERADQLRQMAQMLVDEYWILHTQEAEKQPRKNKGYILPRCRVCKGSLHIEWLRQRIAPTVNPKTHRPYVFSDYLPKGRECRYPEAAFQRAARDWELPLIQEYEALFADLRQRAQAISQVRQQIRRRLLKPAGVQAAARASELDDA